MISVMDPQQLSLELKRKAAALGFSLAGIIRAAPSPNLGAYEAWLRQEYHGEMGYMARPDRVIRRRNLQVILPDIQSMVCVALDYACLGPGEALLSDPSRGRISNYAWGVDYHELMTPRLEQLAQWLRDHAGDAAVATKVYVDTGAILERDHAAQAGLGFTGKNTMLIAPRRGSWLFLGELLTNQRLIPDRADFMPSCGRCSRCLDACPTDAFPQPYVLDARRCISYLTIELKGWIPRSLRKPMGNWLYGCDICQQVCPFNRFAPVTEEAAFKPLSPDAAAPPLLEILALDEAEFQERFRQSPILRIKRARLVRNACVNAGNWGSKEALPPLRKLLRDANPIIRGHAAWAVGEIGRRHGRNEVEKHLHRAARGEDDLRVHQELRWALGTENSTGPVL